MGNSSFNILYENILNNNSNNGLDFYGAHGNIIYRNNIDNNTGDGIHLATDSNTNTICGNMVRDNKNGVYLSSEYGPPSSYNIIYLNDIYGNSINQSYEEIGCIDNKWDNGTHGNFWESNYTDKYPSATNNGFIWNIPYEIDGVGGGEDNFPLVNSIEIFNFIDEIYIPNPGTIPDPFEISFIPNLIFPLKVTHVEILIPQEIFDNAGNMSIIISQSKFSPEDFENGQIFSISFGLIVLDENNPVVDNHYNVTDLQNGTFYIAVLNTNSIGTRVSNVLEIEVQLEVNDNPEQFPINGYNGIIIGLLAILSIKFVITKNQRKFTK